MVFEPDSPEALAEALRTALADGTALRAKALAARPDITARYSAEAMVQGIERVFEAALPLKNTGLKEIGFRRTPILDNSLTDQPRRILKQAGTET